MPNIALNINGRSYNIACEEGQESRLQQLGEFIDGRMGDIAAAGVARTESHLMVLTALVLADELFDLRENAANNGQSSNANQEDFATKLTEALQKQEAAYAEQVDALSESVENLVNKLKKA